ncbi:MAG TPA: MmgE/PrpD family protein [Burkholderiales bacterium]|nr:MmgE/PrpD family protein [Burkholderiales bacterium]
MQETQTLAKFVADTGYADLPASLIAECKIATLDVFAAAFVGSSLPWAQRVVEMVRELGGAPEASVVNQPWKTDVSRAALANGAMIGAFECEPLTGSHAGGTVLPAALAVSQREHLDGKAFLLSLAVGFEVSGRLHRTAVGLESKRGFHNPGVQGPFGAAAAVGKLYGFDAATLASALGFAGSCAAGLLEFAWRGDDTKRVHLGRASSMGLESALLARKGLNGPVTVIEGPYGYFNAFSEPTDIAKLTEGLGKKWIIQPASHKAFAAHVTQQAVVQAIQDLKREHGFDPGSITRVTIKGAHRILEDRHTVRDPVTVMGGQYSLPFTAAVALTRDMSNPLVYDDAAVKDPLVRSLAQNMELIVDKNVHDVFPAEITIVCGDKTYRKVTSAHKGSPHNPLTWADACEKFSRYTRTHIAEPQARAIMDAVADLENQGDMARVATLLASQ